MAVVAESKTEERKVSSRKLLLGSELIKVHLSTQNLASKSIKLSGKGFSLLVVVVQNFCVNRFHFLGLREIQK
jgi:hypothetical protein